MHSKNCLRTGTLALAALGVSVLSIAGAAPAQAAIVGLYNTGVDINANQVDQAWTIVGGANSAITTYPSPAYADSTNGVYPVSPAGPWVPNSAISSWDTPTKPISGALDPTTNGTYVYQTQFTVTGSVPSSLAFQFAADNEVSSITLNGTTIYTGPGFPTNQYSSFTSVVANNLQSGSNILDFTVVNYAGSPGNYSGLDVQFAPTPGPAPGVGLAGLAALTLAGLYARTRRA
jgi:hypothetical protein